MNGKKAKQLRKMARAEMIEDPNVDYVASSRSRKTMVNSPNSVRCMYLKLKAAYLAHRRAGLGSRSSSKN